MPELHTIYLSKHGDIKPKKFVLPRIREPRCELDLIYLIGRYWDVIRERTGLEEIVFVDKHWDAEGIYRGRKVRIEVKLDAKDFDKDPTKIDLLICWKLTPSGSILKQLPLYGRNDLWIHKYNLKENEKDCLRNLLKRGKTNLVEDLIKEIFRCVGIEIIVLSEILK